MPACDACDQDLILSLDMSVSGSLLEDGHTITFTLGLSISWDENVGGLEF